MRTRICDVVNTVLGGYTFKFKTCGSTAANTRAVSESRRAWAAVAAAASDPKELPACPFVRRARNDGGGGGGDPAGTAAVRGRVRATETRMFSKKKIRTYGVYTPRSCSAHTLLL